MLQGYYAFGLYSSAPWATVFVFSLISFAALIILWISAMANRASSRNLEPSRGYILHSSVTHARYLPAESKHAFTYPALYSFVPLRALEGGRLNLGFGFGGWVFGYGRSQGRLTAINPAGYLRTGKKGEKSSIAERLEELLRSSCPQRHPRDEPLDGVHDAWMLTMPSYFGWEGINPLTVYFVYTMESGLESSALSHVVLEVHNTFGEGHVYVLRPGEKEDPMKLRSEGYDHQWTLPREFHVSPFNDRSGYYTIAVKRPTHSPFSLNGSPSDELRPPKPTVRVQLYTERRATDSTDELEATHDISLRGDLKLTAILRANAAYPLTTSTVVWSVAKMPLELFLTTPRILYQAWILHYGRPRLDVYLRPEMKWASLWRSGVGDSTLPKIENPEGGGGVTWLGEGLVERYSRRKVEEFLRRRVDVVGIQVTLIPANPAMDPCSWSPASHGGEGVGTDHLQIWYLSPKFFSTLLLAPSAEHALLLGSDSEGWFRVSSRQLFNEVFCDGTSDGNAKVQKQHSGLQRLRLAPISKTAPAAHRDDPTAFPVSAPFDHYLDTPSSFNIANYIMISLQLFLDKVEERAFKWTKARVVKGQEPWLMWERAASASWGDHTTSSGGWVGSVRSTSH